MPSVSPERFDFGRSPEGTTVSTLIQVTNPTEVPVVITDIKTGCGCLAAIAADSTILPDDSLTVRIEWELRSSDLTPVGWAKTLYVFTSSTLDPIRIPVTATPPTAASRLALQGALPLTFSLRATAQRVSVGLINPDTAALGLTVVSKGGLPLRVDLPDSLAPRGRVVIAIDWTDEPFELPWQGSLTIEARSPSGMSERLSIPLRGGPPVPRPRSTGAAGNQRDNR